MLTAVGIVAGCTDGTSVAVAKAREGEPALLCHAICERVATCEVVDGFEGVQTCTNRCIEQEALWMGTCQAHVVALLACELRQSCEELRSIRGGLERVPTDACAIEQRGALYCPPTTPAVHIPPVPNYEMPAGFGREPKRTE